jgi:hypothetical protein
MINFIFSIPIESVGLCSTNDTTDGKPLFSITFGSNSGQYSSETPSSFGFSTSHEQQFASQIAEGMFGFVNLVPERKHEIFDNIWLNGEKNKEWDHTENDTGGYMYIVNVAGGNSKLFRYTANYLCIGLRYEFSAYLANVLVKKWVDLGYLLQPNIRFEVRTATNDNQLVAQFSTDDIPAYEKLTWSKYGLSFNASSTSVVLLMISNAGGGDGNDLAIDDIELRVCSTNHSGFCPPGQCIYYSLNMR